MRALLTVVVLALLAGGALAHGPVGVTAPDTAICVCSDETDPEGLVDPCSTGTVWSAPEWRQVGPPGELILFSTKVRRIVARARERMTEPSVAP